VIHGYTAATNSEEDIDEGVVQGSLRVSLEYGLRRGESNKIAVDA
jgi:hypothetical protein